MNPIKIKASLVIALTIGGLCAAAAGQNSRPPKPYVDKGACPFECCTYRSWTVVQPTTMYSAMRDGSTVAFRLKKGERVKGLTGTVITSEAGEVRALKHTRVGDFDVKAGDTLYVLTYQGEGFHLVWYKGKITQGEVHDDTLFRKIRDPKSVWWVKVGNSRRQTGWSREPEHFGNMDQCG